MTDHDLAILTRQISDLSGRMALAHAELRQMLAELAVLSATVRELAPGGKLAAITKGVRVNRTTKHGSISRSVLDALRRADGPLTAAQVAAACGCSEARALMALQYQRGKATVESREAKAGNLRWGLMS